MKITEKDLKELLIAGMCSGKTRAQFGAILNWDEDKFHADTALLAEELIKNGKERGVIDD